LTVTKGNQEDKKQGAGGIFLQKVTKGDRERRRGERDLPRISGFHGGGEADRKVRATVGSREGLGKD